MAVAKSKGHLDQDLLSVQEIEANHHDKPAKESWNDEPKKSIQYFIQQSIPMPESNMMLGQEVPSYCHSVMKGHIEVIKKAHAEKRDINTTLDNKSRCLLHCGILAMVDAEKRYRNLELLLKFGTELEQRDECGRTPLHLAVLLGDLRAVDVLLKGGCNPRAKCHGNSLLHLATISGNIAMFEKVRALPACGFNPCDLTEYGFTMVHVAALYDQHQMIPFLKKCGVSIDQTSRIQIGSGSLKGVMPVGIPAYHQYLLQYAQSDLSKKMVETIIAISSRSSSESVEKLDALANGLTEKEGNNIIEEQPIFCAVKFGFLPTVKALVEEGADTSIVSTNGNSLLQTAVTFGHLKIVKYLFPLCAWVSGRSHPILLAAMLDAADVVRYLVKAYYTFDLPVESIHNSKEAHQLSLLDLAVSTNRPHIIQLALEMEREGVIVKSQHSQNPNILLLESVVGGWTMTLLSKAIPQTASLWDSEKHQQEVISYLLGLPGCDPLQILPNVDCCALDLAVMFSQSNAVNVLLSHLKRSNIYAPLTSLSMYDSQHIPFPHLCMRLPYTIQQSPLKDGFIVRLLSSVPYPEDIFFTTFEVLLSHGYDINALDSNGLTCLDHAINFRSSKVQEFLRSHGASTTEELKQKKMLETAEEMAKENERLSADIEIFSNVVFSALKYVNPEVLLQLSSGRLQSTQPSASAPSQMSEIELEDGINLTRPDILRMAAHWSTIAVRLGIEQPIIDIIKHDNPSQAERACHEMLCRWCARDELTGKQPRTLDAVLTAMKACGLEDYAKQVQKRH